METNEDGATEPTNRPRARRAGEVVLASGTALGMVGGSLVLLPATAAAAEVTITVTSTDDSPAEGTLRWALDQAELAVDNGDSPVIVFDLDEADGDVITLDPALGQLELRRGDVEVDGPGAAELSVDAAGLSRVFYLYAATPGAVTISGLTITRGATEDEGGAGIHARRTDLVLDGVTLTANNAAGDADGGGLSMLGGSLVMSESTVSGNTAGGNGGGMELDALTVGEEVTHPIGAVTITSSTISGNTSGQVGGGAMVYGATGPVTITGPVMSVDANHASAGAGGMGIVESDGNVSITGTVFTRNSTSTSGGSEGGPFGGGLGGGLVVAAVAGDLGIGEVSITGDAESPFAEAAIAGGAVIQSVLGETTITGTTIEGNQAKYLAGGAWIGDLTSATITDSQIDANHAPLGAGGLMVSDFFGYDTDLPDAGPGSITIEGGSISDNSAAEGVGGGAAIDIQEGEVILSEVAVSGNQARQAGGGIAIGGGSGAAAAAEGPTDLETATVVIERSTIDHNDATGFQPPPDPAFPEAVPPYVEGRGGGVHVDFFPGEVNLVNSTVSGNTADRGAGVHATDTSYGVWLRHATIAANTAALEGGGVFGSADGLTPEGVESEGETNVYLDHTIVADNSTEGTAPDVAGIVEAQHSLIEVTEGGTVIDRDPPTDDNVFGQDPILGPLAANGGPTLTHLPDPDTSPAVDRGDADGAIAVPATDQRGQNRVQAEIDIGSVETAGEVVDPVEVSVTASDGFAEEGSDTGAFTFTRTGPTDDPLTVDYELSGDASSGDYEPIGLVTFPAGSATVVVEVVPVDDTEIEGDELVTLSLAAGPGYVPMGQTVASVTIVDDDEEPGSSQNWVSVRASDPVAEEGGQGGSFTFHRSGPTNRSITIAYGVDGTASAGDFQPLGTVTFAPGQRTVTLPVEAVADAVQEGDETVVLTLQTGTGYRPVAPHSATVTIVDQGAPQEPTPDEPPCEGVGDDGFTDVGEENEHQAAIACLAALGISQGGPQGLPADQYGPGLAVTRGQMATFLARLIEAAGVELPGDADDAFDDDDGTEHEGSINALFAAGIIEGFDDGTFGEGEPVDRDQMASFLLRTYEFVTGRTLPAGADAFDDDEPGNVHEAAINALAAAGVIQGTETPGVYDPDGDVRRDQMASFLARLAELLASEGDFPLGT